MSKTEIIAKLSCLKVDTLKNKKDSTGDNFIYGIKVGINHGIEQAVKFIEDNHE